MTAPIDHQRALFRFLSKSARKREPAAPAAAAARLNVPPDRLAEIAAAMQRRIDASWPDAPPLSDLLDDPDTETLAAIAAYDWVLVGVYSFGLPPTKTRSGSAESAAHRALKEWAAAHPEQALAPPDATAITERWFPSGDEIRCRLPWPTTPRRSLKSAPPKPSRTNSAAPSSPWSSSAPSWKPKTPWPITPAKSPRYCSPAPQSPPTSQTLASHLNLQILPAQPRTH